MGNCSSNRVLWLAASGCTMGGPAHRFADCNVSFYHSYHLPRKRIATQVKHPSNTGRVTFECFCRGAGAEKCCSRSIRIGVSHAFLPNSEASLCSHLHCKVQLAHRAHEGTFSACRSRLQSPCTLTTGTVYFPYFPTLIPSSLHHMRLDSTLRIPRPRYPPLTYSS